MEILTATPIGTLVAATSPGPCLSCFIYLFLSNKVIIITFCACFWVKENQKPKTNQKAKNDGGPDSQTK
jgi:hypothetical protein